MTATAVPSTHVEKLVDRQFMLVCTSVLMFFLAVGINLPLVAKYVKGPLGQGDDVVGTAAASLSIAAVLIRPVAALVSGRFGSRTLMAVGGAIGVVGFALQIAPALPWFIAARMLAGIGDAAIFVGASTMIVSAAPITRRAEATSYLSVAVFGGLGVGPVFGDALASGGHYNRSFVAASMCCAGAVIAALMVGPLPVAMDPDGGPANGVKDSRPGWFHRKGVRPGIVLALSMAGYVGWVTFQPLRAIEIGLKGGQVFAIYAACTLTLRLIGAKVPERVGLMRCCGGAITVMSGGLVLCSVATSKLTFVVGTVVLSCGMAFVYPALAAMAVNTVSIAEQAALVPTFTAFFEIGPAIGGYPLGLVARAYGYRTVLLVCAVTTLCGLPALLSFRHSRADSVMETP